MSLSRVEITLAVFSCLAQSQAFEVASIKPSGPQSVRGSEGGPGSRDPGMFRFGKATLLDLITGAYDVDPFQVSSKGPLDRQDFDLAATMPVGTSKQDFQTMLQNLLAERFHLKLHIVSKEFAAYEMVIGKSGLKLQEGDVPLAPSKDSCPQLPPGRRGFSASMSASGGYELVCVTSRREPLTVLARSFRHRLDLPVVDKTELSGNYDFTLEYSLEFPGAATGDPAGLPPLPNLFSAIERQLGLQLVRTNLPFDVLMIDSVDKLPSPN
jgi:uncharacterized protein (TIGR03435 family)